MKFNLDTQLLRASLKYLEQLKPRNPGEAVPVNRDLRIAMHNIDIVPRLKLLRDFSVRNIIGGAQIGERLPRENNAPPERIIRPIPLINPDLMRGISLLHQNRKIKPRRPATDDVNLHRSDSSS